GVQTCALPIYRFHLRRVEVSLFFCAWHLLGEFLSNTVKTLVYALIVGGIGQGRESTHNLTFVLRRRDPLEIVGIQKMTDNMPHCIWQFFSVISEFHEFPWVIF